MSTHEPLATVDVAVTIIARGPLLLAVYNPNWGAFTLPMTKRRSVRSDPKLPLAATHEPWADSAARAAAEWLGRTSDPQFLHEIERFDQSDRDGDWKVYHFQVFGLAVDEQAKPLPGTVTEWLAPDAFMTQRPMTLTARAIITELENNQLLPPWPER